MQKVNQDLALFLDYFDLASAYEHPFGRGSPARVVQIVLASSRAQQKKKEVGKIVQAARQEPGTNMHEMINFRVTWQTEHMEHSLPTIKLLQM